MVLEELVDVLVELDVVEELDESVLLVVMAEEAVTGWRVCVVVGSISVMRLNELWLAEPEIVLVISTIPVTFFDSVFVAYTVRIPPDFVTVVQVIGSSHRCTRMTR